MPVFVPIQQKFLTLLQGTITFFASPQPQSNQDRKMVDQLRTDALKLAEEASTPAFEHFLTFLLGSTAIDAHYPLQTIRMLSIVAGATKLMPELNKPQIDELITAAFFADIGFRAAWLGQKGSHAELAAYRLKEMQFAWFTPSLEKMLMGHHGVSQDISAHRIVSMVAHYLAYVYGLGVDVPPATIYSPVKALEALVEEFPAETDSIHYLLRTLSAYPLGSWVQSNTGQVGLVVGSNPGNPLRPRVGYAVMVKQGLWKWEEHALQSEIRVNLQRELLPNAAQINFLNLPHLWIAGWQSQGHFAKEDYIAAFGALLSTDGSVSEPASLQKFLGTPEKKVILPADPASRPLPSPNGTPLMPRNSLVPSPAGGTPDELQHLREDWEKHVQLIEQSVDHLRHGLIDSYRRENEQFKRTIDAMAKNQIVSGASRPTPFLVETVERVLIPLEEMMPLEEKRLREEHASLEELCARVRTALESLPKDSAEGSRMKELLARWQSEWDTVAAQLVDPLHPLPKAFLNLKESCAAARAYLTRLQHHIQKNESSETARWQTVWEGRHRPVLEKNKTLAEEARHEQTRCLERVQRLAQRYLELAENLGDSFKA